MHEEKPKEVLDVDAVIVDDFDLEERSDGLWYKKNLNKPFTGKARRSYPSGKILMEIPYVQGIRQGLQEIWKEDGTLLRQVVWENGKSLETADISYILQANLCLGSKFEYLLSLSLYDRKLLMFASSGCKFVLASIS